MRSDLRPFGHAPRTHGCCRRSGGPRGRPAAGHWLSATRLDRLQHAPVARGGHHEAGGPQAQSMSACNCAPRLPQLAGVIQPGVVQRAAGGTAARARSAASPPGTSPCAACSTRHGSTRRATSAIQTASSLGIEAVERRRIEIELVAQHDDQRTQISHAQPSCVGKRRSSTSRRPSSSPSDAASSSTDRSPRRACSAMQPCCRESWRCAASP